MKIGDIVESRRKFIQTDNTMAREKGKITDVSTKAHRNGKIEKLFQLGDGDWYTASALRYYKVSNEDGISKHRINAFTDSHRLLLIPYESATPDIIKMANSIMMATHRVSTPHTYINGRECAIHGIETTSDSYEWNGVEGKKMIQVEILDEPQSHRPRRKPLISEEAAKVIVKKFCSSGDWNTFIGELVGQAVRFKANKSRKPYHYFMDKVMAEASKLSLSREHCEECEHRFNCFTSRGTLPLKEMWLKGAY